MKKDIFCKKLVAHVSYFVPGLLSLSLPMCPLVLASLFGLSWQPLSCRFLLLLTLNRLLQPEYWQAKGFSPVCEFMWIRRELGLEKVLLQLRHG